MGQSRKKYRTFKFRIFIAWTFTMLLPFVAAVLLNTNMYGQYLAKMVWDSEFMMEEVYQMNSLNAYEDISRKVNNIVLEDPESLYGDTFKQEILDEEVFMDHELIVIVRRNDETHVVNGPDPIEDANLIERFYSLEGYSLPPFMSSSEIDNEQIFDKTGYVVSRQQDFYFDNGDEGSVFILRKVVNIHSEIAEFIRRNVTVILGTVMFISIFLSYKMSKVVSKPIDEMITAMGSVKDGDYSYRMQPREKKKDHMLYELVNSLNDMIIALDETEEYKRQIEQNRKEFLANLSHDLKTPMTSIHIHARAIQDGVVNTPEKMDRYLTNITTKVSDMDRMLNELKVYSDLENDTGEYQFLELDLNSFMNDIVDELKYDVNNEGVIIETAFASDQPAMVQVDPEKLKRVVFNIFANAKKYAGVEPVSVKFSIEGPEGAEDMVRLSVRDNGVGVATEQLEHIFDRFYRADVARNQNQPGSGLGLSIAKAIIEKHGGSIRALSEPGKGLEIQIDLKKKMGC